MLQVICHCPSGAGLLKAHQVYMQRLQVRNLSVLQALFSVPPLLIMSLSPLQVSDNQVRHQARTEVWSLFPLKSVYQSASDSR